MHVSSVPTAPLLVDTLVMSGLIITLTQQFSGKSTLKLPVDNYLPGGRTDQLGASDYCDLTKSLNLSVGEWDIFGRCSAVQHMTDHAVYLRNLCGCR